MTCPAVVTVAGQRLYCNGKHKAGSDTHSVDYSQLPKGFFTGDIAVELRGQGVAWVKWRVAKVKVG